VSAGAQAPRRIRDCAARQRAQREFRTPLVLEAGAGTGKTATLVARILAWTLGPGWECAEQAMNDRARAEPPRPERIAARVLSRVVAITFTEAAAAEMAERVDVALRQIARGDVPDTVDEEALPEPALRTARGLGLLGALDHLIVQTIHAYCRRLLAAHPLDAGLHPELEIDADGRERSRVVREAIERRLGADYRAPGGSAALTLAAHGFGPHEIERELTALLDRDVTSDMLADDPLAPARVRSECERLRATCEEICAVAGAQLHAVRRGAKAAEVARAVEQTRDRLAPPPGDRAALEVLLEGLREIWDASRIKRLRSWQKGEFSQSERAALGEGAERLSALAGALAAPLEQWRELDVGCFDAARAALRALLAEAEESMRRHGIVTFSRLLTAAAELLRDDSGVARRVRRQIDQLLVDEFQDTDRFQCEIVGALALEGPVDERPGLFLVGDPKQSIYGWRSADLAAYEAFVARACAAEGRIEALTVNFRSVPAILDEVERVVEPVMIREAGLQPAFQPLVPSPQNAGAKGLEGDPFAPVEYWIPVADEAGAPRPTTAREATALEARTLAADLRRLHDTRDVPWSEIGLLFRSRGDWEIYLGALREAGVPFAVEGDRSYFRRREVIEAAAAVRCVLDPNDHLALLTLLRSGVVGVPDAALLPLWRRELPARFGALCALDAQALEALRVLFDEVVCALPDDVPGLERVAGWEINALAAAEAIAALRHSYACDPSDVFVERLRTSLLIEVSEAARFLGPWRAANLERFFRVLAEEMAAGADTESVLRRLRTAVSEEEPTEEGQPRDLAPDAVRVLTLHGAKGLDFDHVYLMQLHKGPARQEKVGSDARTHAGRVEMRLLGAPSLGWDLVHEVRQRVADAESVRTLYVGMTRARRRLVLAGLWPDLQRRDGRGGHATLLTERNPAPPDLAAAFEACARDARTDWVDAVEARWVFPALDARAALAPAAAAPAALPDLARVRADSERLRAARAEAVERMDRPLHATATEQAHGGEAPPAAYERGAPSDALLARLAGIAVHRVLELFDLEAEPGAELARQRAGLEAVLAPFAPPDRLAEVVSAARARLDRFASGSLLARLRALRDHVVARELPVLLAARPDDVPLAFLSGTIDLVHREPETGEFVVVDYKTDALDDDAALAARTQQYVHQGAVYQRAVRDAFGLAYTPRFELWYLACDRRVDPSDPPAGLRGGSD
jgi:ATP-dependent helicase/nuclease subunit A